MCFLSMLTLTIRVGNAIIFSRFPFTDKLYWLGTVDKSRIFLTMPRFSEGVPVSLGYVKSPMTSCLIQPYPDYSWHSSHGANCDYITSVVRVATDRCHQLWVLDTGMIGSTRKCQPQLLLFNLLTDKLVKRYKIPTSQFTDMSLHITPVRLIICQQSLTCERISTTSTGFGCFRSTSGTMCKHQSIHSWCNGLLSHCLRCCHQQILENPK